MMGISCGKYRGTYLTNYNRYKYQYNHLSGGKLHLFLGSQLLGSKPLDKSVRTRCRAVGLSLYFSNPKVRWWGGSFLRSLARLLNSTDPNPLEFIQYSGQYLSNLEQNNKKKLANKVERKHEKSGHAQA